MDPILQVLLSWQFMLFGLAIAAVVYVFRTIADYFISLKMDPKKIKIWNELILPIFPVFLGVLVSDLLTTFPYPNGLTSRGDRVIFGLVAGLFSTLMYRVIKALLVQKIDGVARVIGIPAPIPTPTASPTTTGEVIPSEQISSRGQL